MLIVTPYYNKPTQEGLYQHYKAINDAIGIPIIIYNIPARSIVDMSVDTMKRLYELKNIAGVKDATANMARVSQQRAAMRAGVQQLSGEDITALGFKRMGNIAGVKDATANMTRVSQQRAAMGDRTSISSRARTSPRSASWRTAATAASRSHRTSRRACARNSRRLA